ncbi:sensor histidine kinase [Ornithinimicrobium sp. F0845]|uniref:sensor histidine kinase n=1 Tax=Ornithinimicrobium sp. F0845 TaxID=2926412 RepID=UPI001FF651DB|nr:sensor histidine kinase [Ornithinimicrobium sp. F0845]MCK0113029.1 sensor histidine kinase [Ornithinimicrobium sp. F0845]
MRMKDLLWVLPLTVFAVVGTVFSSGADGGWGRGRFGPDGPPFAEGPPFGDGDFGDLLTGDLLPAVLIVAAAALIQLLGRVRPGSTLVATGLLVATYLGLGFHDGPVFLVLMMSSFVAGWHAPLRVWARSIAVALVAVVVGLVLREVLHEVDGSTARVVWQSAGVCGAAVAAGLVAGLVRSRRQAAQERVHHAATEEQLRTAQELHDGVGHGLAVIAMQSGVALHVLDRDSAAVRAALEAIRDTSRESLASLRTEVSRLTGEVAPRRPGSGLEDLPRLAERIRTAGIAVDLQVSGSVEHLPADLGAAVYAIAQEALTNMLRHSRARHAEVMLALTEDLVRLVVRDDGVGATGHHEGMGLTGMRERAARHGGSLRAGPAAGGGFEVVAELPTGAS